MPAVDATSPLTSISVKDRLPALRRTDGPRTIDVGILRLRKASNGPGEIDIVRTVRSIGCALDLA
jgi:DNA-binding response OmpR family regulator